MANDNVLQQLRDIILEDDRRQQEQLRQELREIHQSLRQQEVLIEAKVEPVVDKKVESLKHDLSSLNSSVIMQAIEQKIRDSREEVVEILYPIIGKMVKKYVATEIQQLSDRIDQQLDSVLAPDNLWNLLVSKITGKKANASSNVIVAAVPPVVQEVYAVHKTSGMLLASYSRTGAPDRDMVAAMLTALKSFAEDAYEGTQHDLESVTYGTFQIVIHSSHKFYLAAAVSGVLNTAARTNLQERLASIAFQYLTEETDNLTQEKSQEVNTALATIFTEYDFNK
ncbi:hypothetical protein SAMN05421780_102142 [Flexibacter flexilis DSM 6793]|uniref:Cell envelope biogenesis protein OmpA n=1 Tax=Flexibacter flexilis DSM 6793 TaxID=927664 RepID=A0A1I1FJS9_9BACT|nr:hypothetical protein [Flexibacter flexilis]SFB97310.1 hypothetical protein SAMN05421780_102142 [Flexibacter flexilis DSM 6793]